MTEIVVEQIDRTSRFLEQVYNLADKNTATLGFLPYKAFEEYAVRKGILIARDGEKLAGYLLYRHVIRDQQARIVHLCVYPSYRGSRVARRLFDELCRRTQMLRGIGLLCRRDFEDVNKIWKHLGFVPLKDKPGRRQKDPSELTFWWFDHGHKTLFDLPVTKKTKIAIDANIFFDFQDAQRKETDSLALLGDWLKDTIEIVRTPELLNEINKQEKPHLREKNRQYAHDFLETKKDHKKFESICKEMREIFPADLNDNDESDLKEVAWAVIDPDVHFFVTRDEDLLKLAPSIFESFNLSLLHPVDLFLHLDEISRSEEYRNMQIAGTKITQRRIQSGEHKNIGRYFYNDFSKEKLNEFIDYLRMRLVDRNECSCFLIEDYQQKPLVLYAEQRNSATELHIPIFRVNRQNIDQRLVKYLLLQFLRHAASEKRDFTRITDPYIQESVKAALQEDTFIQVNNQWLKPNIPLAKPANQVADYLEKVIGANTDLKSYYQLPVKLLREESNLSNVGVMTEIERVFWPLKITNSEIPTITIPISSTWASLWFDEDLARQTLFGAHQERALNRDGVYYSSAHAPNISLPARILWYVTKDENISGTQSLRACSRLDDIVIGKPKEIFRQFQHLGIYEWNNISSLVGHDLEREIVAYRFSDTQLFKHPVSFSKWQQITQEIKGKNPPIQSPAITPQIVFEQIYREGMELD